MSFRSFFSKSLSLLFPILVVVGVLGWALWILMSTYFWDTARLTIYLPDDEPTVVHVETRARLIYRDIDLYGFFNYPLHVTLPWYRAYKCVHICVVPSVPAGEGTITLEHPGGEEIPINPQKISIFFAPDTDGVLDLRPTLLLTPVDVTTLGIKVMDLDIDLDRLPGEDLWKNFTQRLVLFESAEWIRQFYDIAAKQVVSIPTNIIIPKHVARGPEDGMYYLWNGQMHAYDRYGRSATTTISELPLWEITLSWIDDNTLLRTASGYEEVKGIWWPMYDAGSLYITDGEKVLKVEPISDPEDGAQDSI